MNADRQFVKYLNYGFRRLILDLLPQCADNAIYEAVHIRQIPWAELQTDNGQAYAVILIEQFTRGTGQGLANITYAFPITIYYIEKIKGPPTPIWNALETLRDAFEPMGGIENADPPWVIQFLSVGDYSCNASEPVNQVLEERRDGTRAGKIVVNALIHYTVDPTQATQFPVLQEIPPLTL